MAIRLVALAGWRDFARKNQLLLAPTAWIQQLRPVSIPFLPSIRSVHIQTTACSEKRKLCLYYSTLCVKLLSKKPKNLLAKHCSTSSGAMKYWQQHAAAHQTTSLDYPARRGHRPLIQIWRSLIRHEPGAALSGHCNCWG